MKMRRIFAKCVRFEEREYPKSVDKKIRKSSKKQFCTPRHATVKQRLEIVRIRVPFEGTDLALIRAFVNGARRHTRVSAEITREQRELSRDRETSHSFRQAKLPCSLCRIFSRDFARPRSRQVQSHNRLARPSRDDCMHVRMDLSGLVVLVLITFWKSSR